MKILIACEFSGIVRDSFKSLGHDVLSCDLEPSLTHGEHYQGDVFDIIDDGFDLMVAHPPCTHLSVSGVSLGKTDNFCICGGTINRWPACYVSMQKVIDFISANQ